jgi:hypothetical protein
MARGDYRFATDADIPTGLVQELGLLVIVQGQLEHMMFGSVCIN